MKLAHLADLHLGFRQFERQTPRGGNQREADVAEAFRRAVDDVLAQRPDLILLAGDIFHSVRPTNPAILFFFQHLQRLRAGLPDAPVVMVAGEHDTPRSSETGTILKLFQVLGIEVVADESRRLVFPQLDCSVLAVPHQAMRQAERPALRPERGTRFNVMVLHGEVEGIGGDGRAPIEYGGALVTRSELGAPQWDYVALGHYHVAQEVAANVWYAGSLEYVGPTPWWELEVQAERRLSGKGYLLVDLPGARVSFRSLEPPRRLLDLPPIHGEGLTAAELDDRIARRVAAAKPAIDDQVVRLVVYDVPRTTARDLDHAAIRRFKSRALHFNLDVRRPVVQRTIGMGAPGRRPTLPEVVREFLGRRPIDAELDRDEFVRLGVDYVERAGAEGG